MRSVLRSCDRGAGTATTSGTTPEGSPRAGQHLRHAQSHGGARVEYGQPIWFGRRSEKSEHPTTARCSKRAKALQRIPGLAEAARRRPAVAADVYGRLATRCRIMSPKSPHSRPETPAVL